MGMGLTHAVVRRSDLDTPYMCVGQYVDQLPALKFLHTYISATSLWRSTYPVADASTVPRTPWYQSIKSIRTSLFPHSPTQHCAYSDLTVILYDSPRLIVNMTTFLGGCSCISRRCTGVTPPSGRIKSRAKPAA